MVFLLVPQERGRGWVETADTGVETDPATSAAAAAKDGTAAGAMTPDADIRLASLGRRGHHPTMGDSQRQEAPEDAARPSDAQSAGPPIDEGEQVDIHRPKPVHGWREFLGEIGVIVIGVLIALGAEQAVEHLGWREKVAKTREQLDEELHADALSAYRWLAVGRCLDGQLDAIETGVRTARQTGTIAPLPAYMPPLVLFTSDAWLNARSLQVADHIGGKAMQAYALVYFFPRELEGNIVQLHQLAAELRPLRSGLSRVSSEEAGSYQRLIGRIRELQDRTRLGQKLLLIRGSKLGTQLTERERAELLDNARTSMGSCATAPDLDLKPEDTD